MIQQRKRPQFDIAPQTFVGWWLRLLLGILLALGAEVLLWSTPEQNTLFDWIITLVGHIALAAIILDLAVRFRLRNLYDVMTIIAIYGLLASLLLYPERTLVDLPRTLATRILGGYTLIGLEMFGLFLLLINGRNPRGRWLLIGYSICVGFAWAIWVRWTPILIDWTPETVSLEQMMTYAGIFLALALIIWAIIRKHQPQLESDDLKLSIGEWLVLLLLLIGLLIMQAVNNALSATGLLLVAAVVVVCWIVVWFRRSEGGTILLDHYLPLKPLALPWIIGTLLLFLSIAAFIYHLPLVTIFGLNQLAVIEFAFAGVGFLWLPTIAAVLGTETFSRQLRMYD